MRLLPSPPPLLLLLLPPPPPVSQLPLSACSEDEDLDEDEDEDEEEEEEEEEEGDRPGDRAIETGGEHGVPLFFLAWLLLLLCSSVVRRSVDSCHHVRRMRRVGAVWVFALSRCPSPAILFF